MVVLHGVLLAKIEHDQKVKGLLNVFGIYDYTNDRMLTHCYQQKKSNQFIDFIERVDSFYDLNIKRIFLVRGCCLIRYRILCDL